MGCDYPSFIQIGPLVGVYGISNILQHGGRPPFWLLKIFIFRDVTANEFQICYSVPNFIKIGSRVRPPDAHNCQMFNERLPGNDCYHVNRIVAATSGTWWDASTQVSSKSVHWWVSYSISNIFQRPSAILNLKKNHIWSCDCYWVPNLLLCTKFH